MEISLIDKFIMRHQYELTKEDWSELSEKYDLSIVMLRLNQNKLNWEKIARFQNLSIETIKEFINYQLKDYIDIICKEQLLTEEFVNEYASIVNWDIIKQYQNFSIDFYFDHVEDIKNFKEKEQLDF